MPKLTKHNHCILIPVYNDADGLSCALSDIKNKTDHNIIVVIDKCAQCEQVAKRNGCITNVSMEKRGYGNALIDGVRDAKTRKYDYITVMDIGTCDPLYLTKEIDCDMIVRNRVPITINIRVALSLLGAAVSSFITLKYIQDATFGYRTYRIDSVLPIMDHVQTNGHATNMEILCLAILSGVDIKWMSLPYKQDSKSELKLADLKESIQCTKRILKYRLLMLLLTLNYHISKRVLSHCSSKTIQTLSLLL